MHIADNDFFEAYKRLDKLCSEMYACQNGVSEYIAQMERLTYKGQYRVSSWNNDYKMLKHVRWVRNQIAHDSGTIQISEPDDLDFAQDFRSRIFSGNDPLTLLEKRSSQRTVFGDNRRNRHRRPEFKDRKYSNILIKLHPNYQNIHLRRKNLGHGSAFLSESE